MDHFRHKHSIKVLKTDLTKCIVYNIFEILLKKDITWERNATVNYFAFEQLIVHKLKPSMITIGLSKPNKKQ